MSNYFSNDTGANVYKNGYAIAPILAGLDDFDGESDFDVDGPDDIDDWVGAVQRAPNMKHALAKMSALRVGPRIGRTKVGSALSKLSSIAKNVLLQTGRIEADYMRRPNTLCSIYTPVIASGATSTFSVTPGVGNAFYRVLGFIGHDDQCNIFGFSALTVGGQNHVSFSQTTPAAPVTNAVPWSIFQLKEGRLIVNLAPWTGQIFDQSSPITGTIVNMTVAASGDAVTVAARLVVLAQTDPCGYRYTQMTEQSRGYWKTLRRNIGAYAPLMLDKGAF